MKLLVILALVAYAAGRPDDSKVDIRLLRSLKQAETADIFVTFTEGTDEVLQAIVDTRFDTRGDKLWAMHDNLISLANRVQAPVKAMLEGRFEHKSFWISNQVYVKGATMDLILQLANRPEVKSLTPEEIIELDTIIEGPIIKGRQDPSGEWGVQMINAPQARSLLNSTRPLVYKTVIATIDTGCRYTHEALKDNWFGPYGWYDPYDKNPLPMDNNGHGTHTTGTICGSHGIGVYPEAQWTSCRGCATSSCAQSALTECGQFVACPTMPDGSAPDCSKAPNLVSNSWGGGRGQAWHDAVIAAYHAGGIIPLFSIGNSGPSCNTANSPGDRDVIGVGSTTSDDGLSSFSSVGPTIDGKMKPDISAPGSNVLSAYNSGDSDYRALSGTSMACPHAAGLTAILMAYDNTLAYKDITSSMFAGVENDKLVSGGKTCDGYTDDKFPNHHHGNGRINALFALQNVIASHP